MAVRGLVALLVFLHSACVEGMGNGQSFGQSYGQSYGHQNAPWSSGEDSHTECGCWAGCELPEENDSVEVFLFSTSVGSIATYACKDGNNDLSGSRHIVCQTDGTWSDSAPSCVPPY